MSMRATLATVLLPLTLLVGAGTASASDSFPQHVADKLALECTPGCQLCHVDAKGGPARINGYFGTAARQAGLKQQDLGSLDAALAAMAVNMTLDSDMDGAGDIAELLAGEDPNTKGGELCIGPKYGCGASTITRAASKRGLDPAATLAGSLLLLGLLLLRRRN
jgi:hypothetical protein